MLMGLITTGIISFLAICVNVGFSDRFVLAWAKSWLIGYLVAVPSILLIAPRIAQLVECWFNKVEVGSKRIEKENKK